MATYERTQGAKPAKAIIQSDELWTLGQHQKREGLQESFAQVMEDKACDTKRNRDVPILCSKAACSLVETTRNYRKLVQLSSI